MIKKLLLLNMLLLTFVSSYAQKSEEELIRDSFDLYKTSILNDQGEEAVTYVDSRTIKYYSEILEKTKHADSTEVDSLGSLDKLMVLTIRHQAEKEEILSFDGKGLLVYAIREGMVGKNSVVNNAIGDIEIDGDFAQGQLVVRGKETPFFLHFYKEEDLWKVDLTSLFLIGSMAFNKMQESSGMSENEYLFMLLEIVSGEKPGSEIWQTIE